MSIEQILIEHTAALRENTVALDAHRNALAASDEVRARVAQSAEKFVESAGGAKPRARRGVATEDTATTASAPQEETKQPEPKQPEPKAEAKPAQAGELTSEAVVARFKEWTGVLDAAQRDERKNRMRAFLQSVAAEGVSKIPAEHRTAAMDLMTDEPAEDDLL